MATPIYRSCLKQFWKRMENADVTITAASPDTYSGTVQRYTFPSGSTPGIVDHYFYQAGQALVRALQALSYDEVYKIAPALIGAETVTLTAGAGNISASNVYYVYDRCVVFTSGDSSSYKIAQMLETWERDEIVNNLNPRKTPSANQRYFECPTINTVNVYPNTYNRIIVRFLKSCPLQVSTADALVSDPFPEILSDIWIDMACQIAAGDLKDSLELVITKRLQDKFSFLNRPKQKTPNNRELLK